MKWAHPRLSRTSGMFINQIQDETAKGSCQTAPWITQDLTQNNKLAFSSTANLKY